MSAAPGRLATVGVGHSSSPGQAMGPAVIGEHEVKPHAALAEGKAGFGLTATSTWHRVWPGDPDGRSWNLPA